MAAAGGIAAAAMLGNGHSVRADEAAAKAVREGRLNQSVCKWCYGKIPLEQFCQNCVDIGLKAIDLLGPGDFATLKKHGLACSMTQGVWGGIGEGFNRKENHEKLIDSLKKLVDANAEAGFPNVICFSGNRKGMSDDEGMKNCAEGIKQIMGYAEQKKVNIIMELLNSKRDHKDYMCDHTKWGVDLCKMVGSDRFKLLYDIYHMQIDEGDVIATIKQYKDYLGHYHTGGNPGRNEIDETQELYYPAIAKTIADTGFKGYFAHEFIPKRDPITSLTQAAKLCTV
jgi:hydroxypyruvate isomerase